VTHTAGTSPVETHAGVTTVRDASSDVLRLPGLTTAFANPGSTEVSLPEDPDFVPALHEDSVVGAATGWALVREQPMSPGSVPWPAGSPTPAPSGHRRHGRQRRRTLAARLQARRRPGRLGQTPRRGYESATTST
jgi:hypothetical protein